MSAATRYRVRSTEWVHAPTLWSAALRGALPLNEEGLQAAVRLYYLSALMPTAPVQVLVDVVEGRRDWQQEGNDIIVGPLKVEVGCA